MGVRELHHPVERSEVLAKGPCFSGFFEKGRGGGPSGAPHLPGNSAYYQCFDSWNTLYTFGKILIFEQVHTFLLQQLSPCCCYLC